MVDIVQIHVQWTTGLKKRLTTKSNKGERTQTSSQTDDQTSGKCFSLLIMKEKPGKANVGSVFLTTSFEKMQWGMQQYKK